MNTPDPQSQPAVRPVFAYIGLALSFAFLSLVPVTLITELKLDIGMLLGVGSTGITILVPCLKVAKLKFHFSTALILFFAASGIVALNCFASGAGGLGFPMRFSGLAPGGASAQPVLALWLDSLLAIEALFALAIFCEWRIARAESKSKRGEASAPPRSL